MRDSNLISGIAATMPVTREEVDGIKCFTITNSSGVKLSCISQGATVTKLVLPDG